MKAIFTIIGTPAWANAGTRAGTRPRRRSRICRRSRRPRRAATPARSRAPDGSIGRVEQLDRLERAEQPGLPEAAVRPLGRQVGDPERQGLRADLQRRREGGEARSARATRSPAASPPRAGTTSPGTRALVGLAARLPAGDEAGGRDGLRRLCAPPVLRLSLRDAAHGAAAWQARAAADCASRSATSSCSRRSSQRLYGNMRIWVTEYGYQTNPPDRSSASRCRSRRSTCGGPGTSSGEPAGRHVHLVPPPRRVARRAGWQSGLYTAAGKAKPARQVFKNLGS